MKLILLILILVCIILFIRIYTSSPVKSKKLYFLTLFNQREPFNAASCSNYQVFNSNENICETVSPENYPLAPIQTMVLKTRGSPGKTNFKECTSLTSGDCVLLYNNNGIMQTAFPCSDPTPIYDFNTNMCTPEYDSCCGIIPSLKTYSLDLNSCKKRMELDSINSTTTSNCLLKNSNVLSNAKKCCGNSANAGRSVCSNYWTPAYKWKLNQSPPIAGLSCPGSIQTGVSRVNSPFTDYAEYNQTHSNVIMVPEEKIVFLEDVKRIFENANILNSPKNPL